MTYLPGEPIETLETASQAMHDAAMCKLITLTLRELFEFGVMQTDPNFANYPYQPETGKLVLPDFGAARPIDAATALGYRRLLLAGVAGDQAAVVCELLGDGEDPGADNQTALPAFQQWTFVHHDLSGSCSPIPPFAATKNRRPTARTSKHGSCWSRSEAR
jgi:predicted unusual protein kinase regulating ubiquinone biosynthesis (AarF/ABC1/UbiB family)